MNANIKKVKSQTLTSILDISKLESATNKKIDLVILNNLYKKSPLLAYNIYLQHKIIFLKDEKSFKSFKENALHYYMDFEHILDEQNRAFLQRIADGNLAKTKTAKSCKN